MRKSLSIAVLLFSMLFAVSCASFMSDQNVDALRKYEKKVYILKKNVVIDGNVVLKKGERIKLYIVDGDEWVKVYGYKKNEKLLKAKKRLILYIFEEDFPDEIYDEKFLKDKLFKYIR